MKSPGGVFIVLCAWLSLSCGAKAADEAPAPVPMVSAAAASFTQPESANAAPPGSASAAPATAPAFCPDGMKLVDGDSCSEVRRRCLDDEYNKANKITICNRFAEQAPQCVGEQRRYRFCIDEYEYPNQKGARSPVMVDFYDAMALCGAQGKRLCWEGEWIAACEGPQQKPFPYGYARSKDHCNIDNPWLIPSLTKAYDTDPAVSSKELTRLDQGVASGSRERCVSDYGVRDQTGNVDEWVMLERKRGKGGWAGLKGGAWGHVRNACRPVTTSHAPDFTYYFVSLRCCADAKPDPTDTGKKTPWKAPPLPTSKKAAGAESKGFVPPVR